MAAPNLRTFTYKAVQSDGKTRRGRIAAVDEAAAFARLRAENLSPLALKAHYVPAAAGPGRGMLNLLPRRQGPREADTEALLGGLAVLLRAGADIRTALSVLGEDNPYLMAATQQMLGGSSAELALSSLFGKTDAHLGALIAAGEMRGDLPSGLEAAAQLIATRRSIREQLIEALSYPAFVFLTAVAAMLVILLVVIPAIAPLLDGAQQAPPFYFRLIVGLSAGLRHFGIYFAAGAALTIFAVVLDYRYGAFRRHVEGWALDGPLGGIVRPLVFGGYAKTLGEMLSRGASLTEALRLCQKSVANTVARERLDVIGNAVRQGRLLSEALRQVRGFPRPLIKLCEVGEASGALGPMLTRAGAREEADAIHKIGRVSKLLGPLLIMALGGLVGLIMGGVLTALTDVGAAAG